MVSYLSFSEGGNGCDYSSQENFEGSEANDPVKSASKESGAGKKLKVTFEYTD
jgi:hypothetical protein